MSTDAFAPAVFPRLHASAMEAEHARARLRGYAEGHAEGYRVAAAAAAAEQERAAAERAARDADHARAIQLAVSALHAAALSLSERASELAGAAQERVFGCAVELAEVILATELADGEASATTALRRALTAADPADVRDLRLNPDDLDTLRRADGIPEGFALVPDADLLRGDAVIGLEDGLIDARIGAALDRARRAVGEAGS